MQDLKRYSKVDSGMKREFLLLVGKGCKWRKCTFCDYHEDCSPNPFLTNKPILDLVTGEYGVLDIVDSGSVFELDDETIKYIKKVVVEKNIHTLWLETHYMYRKFLKQLSDYFPCTVKYRVGAETFDQDLRDRWNKGIPHEVTAEMLAKDFKGVCMLVGIKGQTKEGILRDLELADRYFEYYSVNLFNPNSTATELDSELAEFVRTEVKELLSTRPKAELLIENTDLGVG